jgi:hypothetical protein
MKNRKHRNVFLALTAMTAFAGFKPAEAQYALHPSFYGSGEVDTRHSQFYLLGMYVGVGGLGWSPYFNINGYALHYHPVPDNRIVTPTGGGTGTALFSTTSTLSAVAPTVGLAYASRTDGVSLGAGYAFVHNDNPGAPGAEGGGSDGVTASVGAYHNGSGRRAIRTQLLSSYNFGSQYVWARGRASIPFRSQSRIGAEIVGQGGGKDNDTSNSWQVGPTFEYAWTRQLRTTFAAGWKSVGGTLFDVRENAAYLKAEFSFSP